LRLQEAGIPFLRLNKESWGEYRLSLDPSVPALSVQIGSNHYTVTTSLRSVWFRQPVFLRNTPAQGLSPEEQLERSQWNAFLRALAVFDSAKWMNLPQAVYLAECKPYQLMAAKRCGLSIPTTRVGNSSSDLKMTFSGPVIIKSLDTVLLREAEDCLFTYSTIVDTGILTDEIVKAAPLLVQEYISHKTDCRITFVGSRVFAVRILSGGAPIEGDWRKTPKELLEYEDFVLPQAVEEQCKNLMQSLGLAFGGLDMLETSNGYTFLEVNPTGEWGWLCRPERLIDHAIRDWLIRPPGPTSPA
jgi:glutathione synthase/RimK-type ligase-like ATP-grasp enzyme